MKTTILKGGYAFFRRFLSVFLVLALILTFVPVNVFAVNTNLAANGNYYGDVPTNHWAHSVIARWSGDGYGVLQGSDDDGNGVYSFLPSKGLSLGELATILAKSFGYIERTPVEVVPAWADEYVEKAVAAGVIAEADKIDASAVVTREQAIKYIAIAYHIEPVSGDTTFIDDADISEEYKPYVNAFQKLGYVAGDNADPAKSRFNPKSSYTRAEAVQVIDNTTGEIADQSITGQTYTKDLIVRTSGVVVKDTVIKGNLIIGQGVGNGEVTLDNVTLDGQLFVFGGGSNSIVVKNGATIKSTVVDKQYGESTHLDGTFESVTIAEGTNVIISGTVAKLVIRGSNEVSLNNASVAYAEINGDDTYIISNKATVVENIAINANDTTVSGNGKINNVFASGKAAFGVQVFTYPTKITVASDAGAIETLYNGFAQPNGTLITSISITGSYGYGSGNNVVNSSETSNADGNTVIQNTFENGFVETHILDDNGNLMSETVTGDGVSLTNSYDYDGEKITSVTNSLGFTTSIEYDRDNVIGIQAPQGNSIQYSYNEDDELSNIVVPASGLIGGDSISIEYAYDDEILTSVSSNGQSYFYEYDENKNLTAIRIGEVTLLKNEYDEGGLLIRETYANGQTMRYEYNAYDKISAIYFNEEATPRFEYSYNEDWNLTTKYDYQSDRVTVYQDDSAVVKSISTGEVIYTFTIDEYGVSAALNVRNSVSDDGKMKTSDFSIYASNTLTDDFARLRERAINKVYVSDTDNDSNDDLDTIQTDDSFEPDDSSYEIEASENDYGNYESENLSDNDDEEFGDDTNSDDEVDVSNDVESKDDTDTSDDKETTGVDESVTITSSYDILRSTFSYLAPAIDQTSEIIDSILIDYANGSKKYDYTYDENGYISSVSENLNLIASYLYDEAGQLVRVNDNIQRKTFVYQYDIGGNIVYCSEYTFSIGKLGDFINSISYTYSNSNWNDQLTAFNGVPISYDESGNPVSYADRTFTWQFGRELKSVSSSESAVIYRYDDTGIRTQKTIIKDGYEKTVSYATVNGKVIQEKSEGDVINYYYDQSDIIVSIEYQGEYYFYITNLQGDIVGLVDSDGNLVVEYTYDAWGNVLSITGEKAETLGVDNPMRYRGYYYDDETGYYYCQSRYYVSDWGRWLNADNAVINLTASVISGIANPFAYCANNPVNNVDVSGYFGTPIQWACAVIGGVAGWYFGDYVAKQLGYRSGVTYWAIRAGVVIGGSVIGWFAGSAVTKVMTKFLAANPTIKAKIPGSVLSFLGLDGGKVSGTFVNGQGFATFDKLKNWLGTKSGTAWHHIVGQTQIQRSGFAATKVHNTGNVIRLTTAQHQQITKFYNSKHSWTGGKVLYEWMAGKSFQEQYRLGIQYLKQLGLIK